jgi:hypothetical protein
VARDDCLLLVVRERLHEVSDKDGGKDHLGKERKKEA